MKRSGASGVARRLPAELAVALSTNLDALNAAPSVADVVRLTPCFERDLGARSRQRETSRRRIVFGHDGLEEVARGVERDREMGSAAREAIKNRGAELLIQQSKVIAFLFAAN